MSEISNLRFDDTHGRLCACDTDGTIRCWSLDGELLKRWDLGCMPSCGEMGTTILHIASPSKFLAIQSCYDTDPLPGGNLEWEAAALDLSAVGINRWNSITTHYSSFRCSSLTFDFMTETIASNEGTRINLRDAWNAKVLASWDTVYAEAGDLLGTMAFSQSGKYLAVCGSKGWNVAGEVMTIWELSTTATETFVSQPLVQIELPEDSECVALDEITRRAFVVWDAVKQGSPICYRP